MPEGRKLTVVDISNPTKLQMIESVDVGHNPDNSLIATVNMRRTHDITLVK
ncbi:hypothetical protein [Rivularia sp. PCC 7116]|uniref:hypothetical protein n=1 Tax=Rivularia sp. PCC 7116 TaxID=373994 RepID=UPI0002E08EAC|nr:hypothetical protein [Rivularia sp. PCC 7116]